MDKKSFIKIVVSIIIIVSSISCTHNETTGNGNNKTNDSILYLSDFTKLDSINTLLTDPKPGDWLYSHPEKGQTFHDYKNYHPVCPNSKQNKIYIQPIGEFDKTDEIVLKALKNYITAFYGLETIILKTIPNSEIPKGSKRIHFGIEQIHTKFILDSILCPNVPDDAIVFTAITSKDLYPADDWNFVFGQAYLKKRTGVSSIYRFKGEDTDSLNYSTYLKRIMKTSTHELGHMFSLKHCKKHQCLLNGSNSLMEADGKPSWLCPECLAKIAWCTKYDTFERYDELIKFCEEYGFIDEMKFYKKSKELLSIKIG